MTITTETATNSPEISLYDDRRQPLTQRQMASLMANLNQNRISTRSQGRATLSYLEAWDVKRALITVFGFGGFDAVASEARVLNTETVPKASGNGFNFRVTVMVRMTLTIHQLGATFAEYAASSQTNPDPGDAMDFAIKTAESDALKRCAINLGTQFGLSLYDDGKTQDVVRNVLAPHQEWPPRQPQQEPQQQEGGPAAAMYPEPAPGVTPDQHQQNLALVNQAFSAKAARDAQQRELAPTGTGN